nr:hypothetical protein [Tanacetum cinerariifolium]
MSSITAQQAKLDLELVPNEKRLEIRKCNGRLNPRKIQREPTFQVVLDDLALTLCYSAFLITTDVLKVYMHQFWDSVYKHDTFYRFKMEKRKRFKLNLEIFRDIFKICPRRTFAALINKKLSRKTTGLDKEDFIYQIENKAYKKQEKMYYPRFTKVIIHYFLTQDKTLSWRNKIGMHTSRRNSNLWCLLPESLTSPKMKETHAYKTYLGFATGATPPKKARKFKKLALPKLTTVPVSTKEPTRKSKRVKRPAKKSTKAPARGVVIREIPKLPLTKKKEKVDVTQGKGIELLFQVALTEDSQFEEVQRKSMRDFYKTHPSGSGTGNDEDDRNNEQDSSGEDSDQENDSDDDKTQSDNENKSDSEHETNENDLDSESDHEENEDDEEEVKDEFVKTPLNDSDDKDETMITNKAEGDEDAEMDYTTNQLYDDVDIRLNEPVDTKKWFVQEEGTDAAMTNIQQENENPEILQVIEDAHVTLYTLPQKTEVLITNFSHSYNLAAKFLNFSDIPHKYAKIVSPMDVHVHHEVPSHQTPILLTVLVSIIFGSSLVFSTVIPQSLPSFTPLPQQSTSTPPPTTKAINPQSALPNFAPVFQFNNKFIALEKSCRAQKGSSPHSSDSFS